MTTVEKKPMVLIMSYSTAREMWLKLNSIYDMKSYENLSAVQKQFIDYKWTDGESVAYNLSKLKLLSNKIKNLRSEIPQRMFITRILSSLPKKFNHFHSAWDSVQDEKRNVNLAVRLMAEELMLQGRSKQQTASRQGSYDSSKVALIASSDNGQDDTCLIDSRMTDHMSKRRNWYSTFEEFSEPVLVGNGNGTTMYAYGKGNINVELHVDKKRMVGTMLNMWEEICFLNDYFFAKDVLTTAT